MAGDIGLFSAGLEKRFSRYSLSGLYGFVPSEISGGPVIETMTLRQTYIFNEWDRFSFYGGLNIFHVIGLSYQTDKFRDSPPRYYQIGGFRGLLNLGAELHIGSREFSSFYFEAGMNDIWIANWLANRREVNPSRHLVLGMGMKYAF